MGNHCPSSQHDEPISFNLSKGITVIFLYNNVHSPPRYTTFFYLDEKGNLDSIISVYGFRLAIEKGYLCLFTFA